MRALFNKDIATGLLPVSDELTTIGPSSTFHIKNAVPESPEPKCYILHKESCTPEQYETVIDGTAIIKDFMVVGTTDDVVREEVLRDEKQFLLGHDGRVDL